MSIVFVVVVVVGIVIFAAIKSAAHCDHQLEVTGAAIYKKNRKFIRAGRSGRCATSKASLNASMNCLIDCGFFSCSLFESAYILIGVRAIYIELFFFVRVWFNREYVLIHSWRPTFVLIAYNLVRIYVLHIWAIFQIHISSAI